LCLLFGEYASDFGAVTLHVLSTAPEPVVHALQCIGFAKQVVERSEGIMFAGCKEDALDQLAPNRCIVADQAGDAPA
jgi:Lhr-like helicase